MDPGGQKSIFCQKTKSSIFRPKLAQKCSLEVSNRFLVKKWKIQIFDQKWTLGIKNRFLVQKSKVQFPTKISPKMVSRNLKSTFGRKIRNSNFRPKIESGGQKLIFGQKIESVIFQPKLAKKWSLKVSDRFLVEKWQIQFFDQKLTLEVKNRFLVKKSKV